MKAIIGIGLPGCGKTTLLRPLAKKEGLAYINADDIRKELTGDARNHSKEPVVWRIAHSRIRDGLKSAGVVIDATHSKRKDRARMVSFCRENGAQHIIGYWVKASLKTCMQRNEARHRVVRTEAVNKMYQRLETNSPSIEEGFDEVIEVVTD